MSSERRPQVDLGALIGSSLTSDDSATTRREPHPAAPEGQPAGDAADAGVMERIAQPKRQIRRRQLNVGLPEVADLHNRLVRYGLDTGMDVQDIVALVLHEELGRRGY